MNDAPRFAARSARPDTARTGLCLGAVDSLLERDADRVAAQVLAAGAHGLAVSHAMRGPRTAAPTGPAAPPIVAQVLAQPGQALDARTRAFFEPRFGQDFAHVRVHADAQAARSAQAIRARAYAAGSHIVLGRGMPAPNSAAGRHLLAHELGHVVQQATGTPTQVQRYSYDEEAPCSTTTRTQIDSGHRLAQAAVAAAQQLLAREAPQDGLGLWFRYLFGAQAEAQRSTIAGHFGTLAAALKQDYTYLCPPATEAPCSHAQAEVLSPQRVAICGQRVQGFSPMGMARLLVHENVRRAQGRLSVFNINDPANGECVMSQRGSEYVEATTDAKHPIPYSCFAEKVLAQQRLTKEKQTQSLFNHLFQTVPRPSFWQGDMRIASAQATVATTVQLHMQMADGHFFVFGSYQYRHPVHGPVAGEIPFGSVEFQDQPEGMRLAIRFDWREGPATGRGYWLSTGEDTLQGLWGHDESPLKGGEWTLRRQP